MRSSQLIRRMACIILFFPLGLLLAPAAGRAQATNNAAPPPAKPAPKPVPAPPRQQGQQKVLPPAQRAQPGANQALVKAAGGRVTQAATQAAQATKTVAAKPLNGVRQLAARAGGGPDPAGLKMPPNARSVALPGGGARIVHPDGRRWEMDDSNHVRAYSRPGMQAKFNGDGRLSSLQLNRPYGNMTVTRSLAGERQTVSMRPGGVRVVTFGRDRGYMERPFAGHMGYVQRTYVVGGRSYARVYRPYRYRGVVYYRYVPAHYYDPRFYGWVSRPWPGRVAYNWGWRPAPWYRFYGGYFAPTPAYPTGALWLTDFLLAANLKLAYQNYQEFEQGNASVPQPEGSGSVTAGLSPEVKDAIAQEVQREVEEEQAAAGQPGGSPATPGSQTLPPALDPNERTFVVSQNLDVPAGSEACALTPGDIIYRTGDSPTADNKVGVNILASKAGDCPANTPTQVEVATLQEMHNQFREQIDTGLSTLATSEGKGGLPSGPAAGPRPDPEGSAPPDHDVEAMLTQDQRDANAAEADATNAANSVASM